MSNLITCVIVFTGLVPSIYALEAVTGEVDCKNIMEFYVDGVLYKNGNNSYWDQPATISIADDTQLIAIKCRNTDEPAGIKVTLSNGVETSAEWKCYNKHEQGWNGPGFNDASWPNAVVIRHEWIWTTGYPQDNIAYCRKDISDRAVVDSDTSPGLSCMEIAAIAGSSVLVVSITINGIAICAAMKCRRRNEGDAEQISRCKCCGRIVLSIVIALVVALAIGALTYLMCIHQTNNVAIIGVDFGITLGEKLAETIYYCKTRKPSNKRSNLPTYRSSNQTSDEPPPYDCSSIYTIKTSMEFPNGCYEDD